MQKVNYFIDNYVEMCWCRRCEKYHNCIEHDPDPRTPHGYRYFCQDTAKRGHGPGQTKDSVELRYRKYADEILRDMGYDPKASIPVYEQFLIKHDL